MVSSLFVPRGSVPLPSRKGTQITVLFCAMIMMMMMMPSSAFTIPIVKVKHHPFLHQNHIRNGNYKEQTLLPRYQSISDTDDDTLETISSSSSSSSNSNNNNNETPNISQYDMPWSTNQKYALQDKISQYTINIPNLNSPTLQGGGKNKSTFALWYTMRKEVVEFMGYDIEYLRDKYLALMEEEEEDDDENEILQPPGVLPYIDAFEFRTNGGIQGRVYGLIGIEPGTQIVTSPLKDVELTLPKGFILTKDGTCAYELGIPKSETKWNINIDGDENMDEDPYSMDLSALAKDGSNLVSNVGKESGRVAENVVKELGDPQTSQMIVNLGASTAVALGAATAMNMLSHHLTVNVFWV